MGRQDYRKPRRQDIEGVDRPPVRARVFLILCFRVCCNRHVKEIEYLLRYSRDGGAIRLAPDLRTYYQYKKMQKREVV